MLVSSNKHEMVALLIYEALPLPRGYELCSLLKTPGTIVSICPRSVGLLDPNWNTTTSASYGMREILYGRWNFCRWEMIAGSSREL